MANNPTLPIGPDENDIALLQKTYDLQNKLKDVMLKQYNIMEDIGVENFNLEAKLNKRYEKQVELLNDQQKELVNIQKMNDGLIGLEGVALTTQKMYIEGAKDRLRANEILYDLLGKQNQIEIDSAKKQHLEDTKWYSFASKFAREQFGFKIKEYELAKSIGSELRKYPLLVSSYVELFATGLVILTNSYNLFLKLDKSAANFRMTLGATRKYTEDIRAMAQRIAIDFGNVGVSIDDVYSSVLSLGNQLGNVHLVTSELVKTTSLLKSQLGISQKTTAAFLRNMASVSKTTLESQQNMAMMAGTMSEIAGIPLDVIMQDISSKTSTTLTMMSRLPNIVLRSTIELRRMGTSLNEAARSSRDILNFTDSVVAEMEASVLLGKSINLQLARELAYRRDLEGSTKEILRITKSIDFENLDVFQQEAFATATGKSVDELNRMLVASRQLEKARLDPNLSDKVAAYDRIRNANAETLSATTANYALSLQQLANQERITSITNKWNQILAKASQIFLPVIDGLLAAVIPIMDIAQGLFAWNLALLPLGVSVSSIFGWMSGILGISKKISLSMMVFARYGIETMTTMEKVFLWVGKSSIAFGKFLGFFGRYIPILGQVIMGIQFLFNLTSRIYKIWNDPNMNFGEKILAGVGAIAGALFDTLVKPFVDAWKAIGSWLGNSPSELGLEIVKGVASVGAMLFNVITNPFKLGFDWILSHMPFSDKIAKTMGFGMGNNIEAKATTAYTPAVTINPKETNLNIPQNKSTQEPTLAQTNEESDNSRVLTDILNAITNLNKNLENGKIGFYLDGQLLSATLARTSEFRNGYGVNKA
jgi:hypothetical protein